MSEEGSNLLPNFLIVGAPRCGTTSLYYYLSQHPDIFMSRVKEPHYFSAPFMPFPHAGKGDNEWERTIVRDLNEYKALFQNSKNAKLRGEASPDYLYSHLQVVPRIREALGDVPIIIMLRNPVERAFSAYMLLRQQAREEITFEAALELEEERRTNGYSFIWLYSRLGFYAEATKSYIDNFSRVHICLHEEFRVNPARVTRNIYSFLGVSKTFQPQFRIYNASGVPRHRRLYGWLTESNRIKAFLKPAIETVYPAEKRMHLVEGWKSKLMEKPSIKPTTRRFLKDSHSDDMLKLKDLINRELGSWLD